MLQGTAIITKHNSRRTMRRMDGEQTMTKQNPNMKLPPTHEKRNSTDIPPWFDSVQSMKTQLNPLGTH